MRWLVLALVLAACAGASQDPTKPTVPTTPSATPSSTPSAIPNAQVDAGAPSTTPSAKPAAPMKAISPSAMEAQLREIGIDPTNLPPLNKLDAKKKRDVMNLFKKALGVTCNHCHDSTDFKAATPNKKIASHMWNDFTKALTVQGGTLFCDSCHHGQATFLDRHDLIALGEWMRENYESKMTRADKKEHNCETCHGDPFEGKIFKVLWKSR